MKTITKKSFIDKLTTKKSKFINLISTHTYNSDMLKNIENSLDKINIDMLDNVQTRFCIKKQSNAIQFNNKSWLYFDVQGKKEYYQHNNYYIFINSYYDEYANYTYTKILIYYIVED